MASFSSSSDLSSSSSPSSSSILTNGNISSEQFNDFDSAISLSLFSTETSSSTQNHSISDDSKYISSILNESSHVMRSIATDIATEMNPPNMHEHGPSSSSFMNLYSLNDKLWMDAVREEGDDDNMYIMQDKLSLPSNYYRDTHSVDTMEELSKTYDFTTQQFSECKQFLPLSLPPPIVEPYYSFSIYSTVLSPQNISEQLKILLTVVNALNSFMPLTSILDACAITKDSDTVPSATTNTDLTVDFDIRPGKQRFQGVVYSNACTSTAAAALFSLHSYVNGNQCIVELQRRYGDCRVFCKFFHALKSLVGNSYEIQSKPFPLKNPTTNGTSGHEGSSSSFPSPPPPQMKSHCAVLQDLGLCKSSNDAEQHAESGRVGTLKCYMDMLSNLIPFMRSQILSKQQDAMRLLCDIFAPRTINTSNPTTADDNKDSFDINLAIQALLEHEKQFSNLDSQSSADNNKNNRGSYSQKLSFTALLTSLLSANDWELRYYTSTLCYYLAQYPAMRETFMSKGSALHTAMCQLQHHPSSTSNSSSSTHPTSTSSPSTAPVTSSYMSSEDDDDYQFRNSRRQVANALHTCG